MARRPRADSHTARPIPKTCQRYITRPSNTVRTTLSGVVVHSTRTGTVITAHATAGRVHRRRQTPGPSREAPTAARVNIVSWAGSVQ